MVLEKNLDMKGLTAQCPSCTVFKLHHKESRVLCASAICVTLGIMCLS